MNKTDVVSASVVLQAQWGRQVKKEEKRIVGLKEISVPEKKRGRGLGRGNGGWVISIEIKRSGRQHSSRDLRELRMCWGKSTP